MPMAVPLIAAGFEVYAGLAALEVGGALVGGLMVAGGALTAVGAISGNKNLMTLGSVLGLAGGVAGIANGAWSTTADAVAQNSLTDAALTESAGNAAVDTASAAGAEAQGIVANAMPEAAVGADASAATAAPSQIAESGPQFGSLYDSSVDLAPELQGGGGADMLAGGEGTAPTAATSAADVQPTMAPAAENAATAAAPAPGPGQYDGSGIKYGDNLDAIIKNNMQQQQSPFMMSNTGQASDNFMKAITDWVKNNKEVAQIGGLAAVGVGNAYSANSRQQAGYDYDQRRRDQYNASLVGLKAPVYQPPTNKPVPTGG